MLLVGTILSSIVNQLFAVSDIPSKNNHAFAGRGDQLTAGRTKLPIFAYWRQSFDEWLHAASYTTVKMAAWA
jgi:hypothetical protein